MGNPMNAIGETTQKQVEIWQLAKRKMVLLTNFQVKLEPDYFFPVFWIRYICWLYNWKLIDKNHNNLRVPLAC